MATMTIRTTVAFDPATVARWERLAQRWGVSKSEALRRALESAENERPRSSLPGGMPTMDEIAAMSPSEALEVLRANPPVTAEQGEQWRNELRETREDFSRRP